MTDDIETGLEAGGKVSKKKLAQYGAIIERIFDRHWKPGLTQFSFDRTEIGAVAEQLHNEGITAKKLPKNLGDVVYTFRHRKSLPKRILDTVPKTEGWKGWLILGDGDAKYRFRLSKLIHIEPTAGLLAISIPDATPEIILKYRLGDEQALLAKIRYNRLIDTFLGITAYSLQNHLRTKLPNYGQIEIDELYTGIDRDGRHYIVPVQAKGTSDKLGAIQTIQDVMYCSLAPEVDPPLGGKTRSKSKKKEQRRDFSKLKCRAVSAQLLRDRGEEIIAMFELVFDGDEVRIKEQRHYKLVPAEDAHPNPC